MSTQTGGQPTTHFRRGWIYVLLLALGTMTRGVILPADGARQGG